MIPQLSPGPRPEDREERRRKRLALVSGGVVLAILFAVLALRPRSSDQLAAAPTGFAFSPGQFGEPGSGLVRPVKKPLPDEEALVTFDDFMSALKQLEDDPTASQFARELMNNPVLSPIVKEFQDPSRAKRPGSLREFMQAMSEQPEFRQLVAKFRSAPGSASVIARMGELPGVAAMVRQVLGQRNAVASASAQRPSRLASAGLTRGQGPGAARESYATGFAAGAAQGAAGGTLTAAAGPSAIGPGGQAAGGVPGGGAPPGNRPGGEAENVVPLGAIDEAGPGVTDNDFMSLCIKQSGISKGQCASINGYLVWPHGIWDACWLADLYDKCVTLCATVPELQCSGNAPGWVKACIDAEPGPGRDAQCAAMCIARGRSDCPAAPPPTNNSNANNQSQTYTIKPGDNLTKIVMQVYGITDPNTAYLTALELYDYGENQKATGNNPYNPNLIFPGKVLTLPPLPELKNMTIQTFN